jgi:hypothetical protein
MSVTKAAFGSQSSQRTGVGDAGFSAVDAGVALTVGDTSEGRSLRVEVASPGADVKVGSGRLRGCPRVHAVKAIDRVMSAWIRTLTMSDLSRLSSDAEQQIDVPRRGGAVTLYSIRVNLLLSSK